MKAFGIILSLFTIGFVGNEIYNCFLIKNSFEEILNWKPK